MAMPNFELSDYEKTRVPHEPKTDNDRVTIAWSSIADHMKCPVCLNIIADTMTTDRSLRHNKKECPTCRQPCASKRALRRDTDFDRLIKIMFPDPSILERYQDQMIERLHRTTNMRALAQSVQEGMEQQALQRKLRSSLIQPKSTQRKSCSTTSKNETAHLRLPVASHPVKQLESTTSVSGSPDLFTETKLSQSASTTPKQAEEFNTKKLIGISLRPLPCANKLPKIDRPFIACPMNAPACILSRIAHKFLVNKFPERSAAEIEIFFETNQRLERASTRITMKEIARQHAQRRPGKRLIMYYNFK
eukprot:gene4867-6888_t